MTDTQKAANIDMELLGRHIEVNEQTTIHDLDEIVCWVNSELAKLPAQEKRLSEVKLALCEFMRQHHTFDLYMEAYKVEPHRKRT